jgi:hypothetical protein
MKGDYKEALEAIELLRSGDAHGVEPAIRFLKADVHEFRSGYLKEYLWRYLSRASFKERQKERLLQVARKYLERQIGREFWPMCRFIRQIADDEFAAYVKDLSASAKDENVRQRASLMAAYLRGMDEGEEERRRLTQKIRYGDDDAASHKA